MHIYIYIYILLSPGLSRRVLHRMRVTPDASSWRRRGRRREIGWVVCSYTHIHIIYIYIYRERDTCVYVYIIVYIYIYREREITCL